MANQEIWWSAKEGTLVESERKLPKMDGSHTGNTTQTRVALEPPEPDPVKAPPHYTRLQPEPIDIIDAWNLPFYPAQVLKYIARAGFKDPKKLLEDLKKARFYLERWIQNVENRESK